MLEMPNFRGLPKTSWIRICIYIKIQEIQRNIRDWEACTDPSQSSMLTLLNLNQVQNLSCKICPNGSSPQSHWFFPSLGSTSGPLLLHGRSNLDLFKMRTKRGPCYLPNVYHLCRVNLILDSPGDKYWYFHSCNIFQVSQNAYSEKEATA